MRPLFFVLILSLCGCASLTEDPNARAIADHFGVPYREVMAFVEQVRVGHKAIYVRVEQIDDNTIQIVMGSGRNDPGGLGLSYHRVDGQWQETDTVSLIVH